MESVYLKTFIESIAAGSFSKAADTLCITPSAVSRRIKFMEDQYGCQLLDRSGPSLEPTDAGRVVLEKARKFVALEEELTGDLAKLGKNEGVSFCSTPAFGISILPEILKRFMMHHPDMNDLKFIFDMPENLVKGLRENRYALGVIEHCEGFDLSDFITTPLPMDEMVFVSSPSLDLPSSTIAIDLLISKPLYSRKEGCCSRNFLEANMKNIGRDAKEFRKMIVMDDLHVIIRSVANGDGIAFLSKSLVESQLNAGVLREHKVVGFRHDKMRSLVMRQSCDDHVGARHFAESILTFFSDNANTA